MFIKNPYLPQNTVNLFACADRKEVCFALSDFGAEVIKIKKSKAFEPCECDHSDMHICHLADKKVVVYKEDTYLSEALLKRGFDVIYAKKKKTSKYPDCAALNALILGRFLVCNKKAVDDTILDYANENEMKIIDCKQGYTRCSSLVVNEKAVITDDVSVYKALENEVEVLLISKADIYLDDNKSGFIGGCAGYIDKNTIAFCGNIKHHPDFEKIAAFLKKHKTEYVCIGEGKLCDIGTIMPLCEA